jgi:hypothetical protein
MKKISSVIVAVVYLAGGVFGTNKVAHAGSGTIGVTAGAGFLYDVITDGSGNYVGKQGICDGTAAANCLAVSSAGAASQNLTQVGGNSILTGGAAGSQGVGGLAASGSTLSGNPVLVGGSDGTDARSLLTDTSGRLIVEPGNTANTTAWLVTGTGGTFPVSQPTAANLNATVVGTGTFAVQATLQASSATAIGTVNPTTAANWGIGATGSGVPANATYMGIVSGGNLTGWTGAVTNAGTFAVQATLQASATTAIGKVDPNTIGSWGLMSGTTSGTAPTNTLITGGIYNSSAPTPSTGQTLPLQLDASGNLNVNIKAGAGSGGTAIADKGTWTVSSTNFTLTGGEFTTGGATACSTGQACTAAMSSDRSLFVNMQDYAGAALSASNPLPSQLSIGGAVVSSTNPLFVEGIGISDGTAIGSLTGSGVMCYVTTSATTGLTSGDIYYESCTTARALRGDMYSLAGTALGAPSNYGTSPGAVEVPGVNAYVTNFGGGTAGSPSGGVVSVQGVSSGTAVPMSAASGSIASGAIASGAVASGAIASGAFAAGSFVNATAGDPCMFQNKSNATVFQTSSGTLITGTTGKKNYICSFTVGASAAAEVSLVEYSGTCTGGTAYAIMGSTTAADGWPLAANGGLTYGNGGGTVLSGGGNTNTGYNVCLLQAGTANVVAQVTYIQQ